MTIVKFLLMTMPIFDPQRRVILKHNLAVGQTTEGDVMAHRTPRICGHAAVCVPCPARLTRTAVNVERPGQFARCKRLPDERLLPYPADSLQQSESRVGPNGHHRLNRDCGHYLNR